MKQPLPCLALILTLCSACGGKKAQEEAEDACNEFRTLLIEADVRCRGTDPEESAALIDDEIDCADVRKLRDETEFFDECLPEFEELSCRELFLGYVPPACRDQMLY